MFRTFTLTCSILLLGMTVMSADEKKTTSAPAAKVVPADNAAAKKVPVRSKTNKCVAIETSYGKMVLELFHDVAPGHADSFAVRTGDGFYNGTIFHRVIDGFMIQGGDPTGTGTGNASYKLKAEFNENPHIEGTLAMARTQDPNSASCQFFICLARAAHLDRQYTVFGQLLKGYDVLHAIGKLPVGQQSRPLKDVVMTKVYLSDSDGKPLVVSEEKKDK